MTCLGVLDRGERGDDNGTSLKEGGLVEMSIKMYNSVIECGKSIKYVYWVKKDLFGLV